MNCKYCGAEISKENLHCPKCNMPLVSDHKDIVLPTKKEKNRRTMMIIIVVLILFIALIIAMVARNRHDNNKNEEIQETTTTEQTELSSEAPKEETSTERETEQESSEEIHILTTAETNEMITEIETETETEISIEPYVSGVNFIVGSWQKTYTETEYENKYTESFTFREDLTAVYNLTIYDEKDESIGEASMEFKYCVDGEQVLFLFDDEEIETSVNRFRAVIEDNTLTLRLFDEETQDFSEDPEYELEKVS